MKQTGSFTNDSINGLETAIGLSSSSRINEDYVAISSAKRKNDARKYGATPIDRERRIYDTYVSKLSL